MKLLFISQFDHSSRAVSTILNYAKIAPSLGHEVAVFGEVAKLIATGKLKSRVQATYDISQIKEAVAAAAAGERDGKILIVPTI